MDEKEKLNKLQKLFLSLHLKPISFYQIYAKIMGSVAGGVFLSQAMYWVATKGTSFWHTDENFRKETCLSEWELKMAKKRVKELGIFEIEVKEINEQNKWYKVSHYKVNLSRLMSLIVENYSEPLPTGLEESSNSDWRNPPTRDVEILQSIKNNIENKKENINIQPLQFELESTKKHYWAFSELKQPAPGFYECPICHHSTAKNRFIEIEPGIVKGCYDCYKKGIEKKITQLKSKKNKPISEPPKRAEDEVKVSHAERKLKRNEKLDEFELM